MFYVLGLVLVSVPSHRTSAALETELDGEIFNLRLDSDP